MSYTLHQLRIFEAVAKAGSITKAAEQMHMTQPAVSIQLKQLQEHFGIQLTEVVGRKLYLTQAGEELFTHIQRISATLQEMSESMDELRGTVRGNLHFTVVSTAKYFMPYFLGAYKHDYPGIGLQLQVTNRDMALRQLRENATDFVVVSIPPDDLEVESLPIMKNPLVVVSSPQAKPFNELTPALRSPKALEELPGLQALHRDASGSLKSLNEFAKSLKANKSLTFDQLAEYPFILREEGSGTRLILLKLFEKYRMNPQIPFELDTNEAIKQAIMAGLGISVISRLSLKSELINGELVELPVEHFPIETQWQLIWLKGRRLSPAARSFLDFMKEGKEEIINKYFNWMRELDSSSS